MSVEFVLEGIELVLQLNRFLLLRVNKDVLDWSQLISHERIQINLYIHIWLFSHLQMKLTTSSMITGNFLIVVRSCSEIGISLSLLSWPESAWMLFARLFIAS